MPTGYTDAIVRNHDISFEEFALRCVRAMGVSVMMRDEPMDKPITRESITARNSENSYYMERLAEAEKKLERLESMGPDDEKFREEVKRERERDISSCKDQIEKISSLRRAYERILDKVDRWEPPTPDHQGLKDFMRSQITESMDFDCNEKFYEERLERITAEIDFAEEYESRISDAKDSVEYARKHIREDDGRNDSRVRWMEQFCESIGVEFP